MTVEAIPLRLLVILGIISLLVLAVLLDRVLLWMERKGWISYRTFNPSLTSLSAMTTFQEFVQPEIRDAEEEKRQRAAENDESDPSDR
jgi:hypothetical protein